MKKFLGILLIILVSQKAMTQQNNINKENSNIPTIVKLDQEHLKLQKETTVQKEFQQISKSKKNQKKANELLHEGREFWNKGELGEAIEKVTEAQNLMPKDQKIMKTLKAMQKQKQMIDDALTKSNQFIVQKKFKEAQRTLRKAERISKKYPLYIETIEKLVTEKKKVDEIKNFMAEAETNWQQGKEQEAINMLDKILVINPTYKKAILLKEEWVNIMPDITEMPKRRSMMTAAVVKMNKQREMHMRRAEMADMNKRRSSQMTSEMLGSMESISARSISRSPVKDTHSQVFYKKNKHTIVDILYGTDRKINTIKSGWETYYTGERGELKYGVAEVSIPQKHKFGAMERPFSFWIWHEDEEIGKHVMITKLETIDQKAFLAFLKSKLTHVEEKDILIFIHGFNVTFASAIRRTAQITYDLKFKGVPMAYSWPSLGEKTAYMYDEDSVQSSVSNLVAFLKTVIDKRGDANIHIIAHSMGTRLLTNALKVISYSSKGQKVFKNVILAAPDISNDVFKKNLFPHVRKTVEQITLYASSDDKALQASSKMHKGTRIGQSGDNIFVFKGLDTIDASGIDTSFLGHSYFAEKDVLIKDLKEIIHKNLPPQKRDTLIEMIKSRLEYWKFKLNSNNKQ